MTVTEIAHAASPQSLPESERILWNRYERFKELLPTIDEDCIKELAAAINEVEVHPQELKNLLEAGCPPELAVRILKPLNSPIKKRKKKKSTSTSVVT